MVKEEQKIVKEVLQQVKNKSVIFDLRRCVCYVVLRTCPMSYLQGLWEDYHIGMNLFVDYMTVIVAKKLGKRGVNYDVDKFFQ